MSEMWRSRYGWPTEILATCASQAEVDELDVRYDNCKTIRDLIAGLLTKQAERGIIFIESESSLDKPNPEERLRHVLGRNEGMRKAAAWLTLTPTGPTKAIKPGP